MCVPQRAARAQEFVRFSPGPSLGGHRKIAGRRHDAKTSSCSWSGSQRRVRLKRRGGFVPSEVRYPGPLSQLLCTGCSLGRERHRTASRLPAAVVREETHGFEVFPQPGVTRLFCSRTELRLHQRTIERRASLQVMSGAGRVLVTSLGTKPIPASSGLFAAFRLHLRQNVFACVGGPQSGDATQNEGPGGSELITCRDARRSTLHYRAPSPFASK